MGEMDSYHDGLRAVVLWSEVFLVELLVVLAVLSWLM
jgi:hypothetical protein